MCLVTCRTVIPTLDMVLFSASNDSSMSRIENSGVTFVRKGSPYPYLDTADALNCGQQQAHCCMCESG